MKKEKPLSGSEAYLINTKALVTLFMLITVLNRNLLSLTGFAVILFLAMLFNYIRDPSATALEPIDFIIGGEKMAGQGWPGVPIG